MRQGCRDVGAPEDLIQVIEEPSIGKTEALMRLADLVVATGGGGMVKAAYSSGTPAYGVGVGNSVHVVDETADLDDAAKMISRAKTFDYATSCLADNSVVAEADIYEALRDKLVAAGGHLCTPEEKTKLVRAMWPDGGHIPSIDVVAKPAVRIAELAGFPLAEDRTFLIVEEDGTGPEHPFSGEKLSVVLALFRYAGGIDAAIDLVNRITGYQGLGHTCGIHTSSDANVEALAMRTKTALSQTFESYCSQHIPQRCGTRSQNGRTGNTLKSDGDSFPRSCQILVADHSRAYKSMASGMHIKGGTPRLRGFVGDASVASRRGQGLPGISLAAGSRTRGACVSREDSPPALQARQLLRSFCEFA